MDEPENRNGTDPEDHPYVHEVPGVCGGYPVIRNTRFSVRIVLGYIRGGWTVDDLAEHWPYIGKERFLGALDYYEKYPARVDEDIERHERVYAEVHGLPRPS